MRSPTGKAVDKTRISRYNEGMQDENRPSTGIGQNQTFTRDVNLSLVMRAFMRRSMSKADLSRIFRLSKPTSSKIVAELERLGFIRPDPDYELSQGTPGVKPLKYSLNTEFGLFAVLDMSTVETRIQLCDLGGSVLSEQTIPGMELITFSDIAHFCDLIDGMYRPHARVPLVAVCVAVPSAVNQSSKEIEWSSRFDIAGGFDFSAYLKERYPGSEILLENDVQLMLSGEIYNGILSDGSVRYALMLYVDAGIGGALYFDGKLENGEEGKAGDLGFLPYLDRNGEYVYLDSVISINAIKKNLQRELKTSPSSRLAAAAELSFTEIRDAYFAGDALAVKVIEDTARETAEGVRSLLEILNINFVIIGGRITRLGERYRLLIESTLKRRFPSIRVAYSLIQDSAIREGAIFVVSDKIIGKLIANRTKRNG